MQRWKKQTKQSDLGQLLPKYLLVKLKISLQSERAMFIYSGAISVLLDFPSYSGLDAKGQAIVYVLSGHLEKCRDEKTC